MEIRYEPMDLLTVQRFDFMKVDVACPCYYHDCSNNIIATFVAITTFRAPKVFKKRQSAHGQTR